MFTNKPACTIWEKTVQNRNPVYIRHVMGPVYWEDTHGETAGSIARDPEDKALCIIHAPLVTYLPRRDDRILPGECADEQPPQNALTVTSVKDFRYGSATVAHIEVTAK